MKTYRVHSFAYAITLLVLAYPGGAMAQELPDVKGPVRKLIVREFHNPGRSLRRVETYEFDTAGRIVKYSLPYGAGNRLTLTGPSGRIAEIINTYLFWLADSAGNRPMRRSVASFHYDESGKLTEKSTRVFDSSQGRTISCQNESFSYSRERLVSSEQRDCLADALLSHSELLRAGTFMDVRIVHNSDGPSDGVEINDSSTGLKAGIFHVSNNHQYSNLILYDRRGNPMYDVYPYDSITRVTTYYYTYDDHGNWITREEYQTEVDSNAQPPKVSPPEWIVGIERSIEYY